MAVVIVTGYTRRLNVIELVKLIQRTTGDTLAPAKDRVDALLEGKPFELSFVNRVTADEFLRTANDIGALAQPKPATTERSKHTES